MSTSLLLLSIIIHFLSVRFLPKTIRLGNIFGTRPDLVKALECPWYYLSILIWSNYFVLKVSFASRFKIPLGLAFNVALVCVFTLFRYLTFFPNSLGIPVLYICIHNFNSQTALSSPTSSNNEGCHPLYVAEIRHWSPKFYVATGIVE